MDILEFLYSAPDSNFSAQWQGNDLAFTADYYDYNSETTTTTCLTIENFALGDEYQIDQFIMDGDTYTTEQFLAEMGLTL